MAKLEVTVAVEARLSAGWAHGATCPIVEENKASKPPKGKTAFLMVQYPVSETRRITFGTPGANVYREEGAFRVVLHVERGSGSATGRQWAAELEALYFAKHFDGVETFEPQSAATDDDNEDGQYFIYAVAVPYRFDFLG